MLCGVEKRLVGMVSFPLLLSLLLAPALGHAPLRRLVYMAGDAMESARLYGNIEEYAYWFVHLMVGSPPQRVSVIADTGSSLAAFPCKSCKRCGRHLDQPFDHELSTTHEWIQCGESDCHGRCDQGHCSYSQSYTEGSSISGWWFRDYVSLGDQFQMNPPALMELGCHMTENKLFKTQRANGIMGMAPPRGGGHPTVLDKLYASPEIDKRMFSMCLASWGGEMVVGGFNRTYHEKIEGDPEQAAEITWVKMESVQYYLIFPTNFFIEGKDGGQMESLGSNFGRRTMVDSGTTYSYFPPAIYNSMKSKIESFCGGGGCGGSRKQGSECWYVGTEGIEAFPTLHWEFPGGVKTRWDASSYMHQSSDRSSKWCYTFDNNHMAETVLGASWMIAKNIIFDIRSDDPKNTKLGIADANCPEYRDRPAYQVEEVAVSTASPASDLVSSPTEEAQHSEASAAPATPQASEPTNTSPLPSESGEQVAISTEKPQEAKSAEEQQAIVPLPNQGSADSKTASDTQKYEGSTSESIHTEPGQITDLTVALLGGLAGLFVLLGCCVLCSSLRRSSLEAQYRRQREHPSTKRHEYVIEDNEMEMEERGHGPPTLPSPRSPSSPHYPHPGLVEGGELPVAQWWDQNGGGGSQPGPGSLATGRERE